MSNPNAIILCIQGQSVFVFMLNSEPGVDNPWLLSRMQLVTLVLSAYFNVRGKAEGDDHVCLCV